MRELERVTTLISTDEMHYGPICSGSCDIVRHTSTGEYNRRRSATSSRTGKPTDNVDS